MLQKGNSLRCSLKLRKQTCSVSKKLKWKSCSKGLVRSLAFSNFVYWVASCSKGASGGVVILWDTRVVQLVGMESSYTLSCRFRTRVDDFCWIFTGPGIYGPTKRENRELLWEDLGVIRGMWGDPWCLGGDFNVLRFPGERNREGRWTGTMRRFSQIIDELELKDMPL